jgi:drug/metabolite transporter (DMT)-like permease
VFFGQRIAANVLGGGALGLLGLGLLFWPELSPPRRQPRNPLRPGPGLLGTLCFSAGNMLSSLQQRAGLKPMTTNAWGMLYGADPVDDLPGQGMPFEMDGTRAISVRCCTW